MDVPPPAFYDDSTGFDFILVRTGQKINYHNTQKGESIMKKDIMIIWIRKLLEDATEEQVRWLMAFIIGYLHK